MGRGVTLHSKYEVQAGPIVLEGRKLPTGNTWEMDGEKNEETAFVVKMKQQHLIVPHARIAQSAAELGFARVTLTGSGDAGVLAALQSRP